MAEVWILAETRDTTIKPVTFELLSVARELAAGDLVTAVLVGHEVTNSAAEVGAHGADKILVVDDPRLAQYSPDGWAAAIARLAADRQPAIIVGAATTRGRELTPRLAAHLGVGLAADAVELSLVDGRIHAVRPIFAGKAIAHVQVNSDPQVATIRPGSYPPSGTAGAGEVVAVTLGDFGAGAIATGIEAIESSRPDVAEADVIVGGGRGMGGPEHFGLIEELADELGAGVAASRAVVDAGWRPHGDQVGQTGKTVSPSLYIACGISGAVQHLAGMKTSKTIVAINKDPEAPIFSVADYGIVGDVFEVLPVLTKAVREQASG